LCLPLELNYIILILLLQSQPVLLTIFLPMLIKLSNLKPFAIGSNRYCYIVDGRVIKVHRGVYYNGNRGIIYGIKRMLKKLPANIIPQFDNNHKEWIFYKNDNLPDFFPKCYGYVATDIGRGLAFDLIIDKDDKPSRTLRQLRSFPDIEVIKQEILKRKLIISDFALCNIVWQNKQKLYIVDGMGANPIIGILCRLPFFYKRYMRKVFDI
jgi:PhoP regulatory network protein YrbL